MPAPIRNRSMFAASVLAGPMAARLVALVLALSGVVSLIGVTPATHPAEVLVRLGMAVAGMSLSVALWGGQAGPAGRTDLHLLPEGQGGHRLRLLPLWGALGFVALMAGAIWSQYHAGL